MIYEATAPSELVDQVLAVRRKAWAPMPRNLVGTAGMASAFLAGTGPQMHHLAASLWPHFDAAGGTELTWLELDKLTRYTSGGSCPPHRDDDSDWYPTRGRVLSMTLVLGDEYSGGDLVVHTDDGPVAYELGRGGIVVFPSRLEHEVTTVTAGQRLAFVARACDAGSISIDVKLWGRAGGHRRRGGLSDFR